MNNRNLFPTVLETVMSKIEVPADLVSDEVLFLESWMWSLWLCPHVLEGTRQLPWVCFCKGTNPIHEGSANCITMAPSPNTIMLLMRFQHMYLGRDTNIQTIASSIPHRMKKKKN